MTAQPRLGAGGAGESRRGFLRGVKDLEDGVQPGELEQVAQAQTEVGQLDIAAGVSRRGLQAHQRAQPGAVNVGDLAELQHDLPGLRQ